MKQSTKENLNKLFVGEVTLKKRELWLVGAVCLLFGIIYGLKKAPLTKGVNVTVGSNNGNHNSNCSNEDADDCECVEVCECDDDDCCCEDDNCCNEECNC